MNNLFVMFFCLAFTFQAFSEMVLDLKSGEYTNISKEEKEELQRKKDAEDKLKKEKKREHDSRLLRFVLPEDTMSKEQWEEETKKNPWKKWVFHKGIVTNDFINSSSNVVVITFLDYEGAARDNIKDINVIREKYKLCCVLHPGDKYIETRDGKNGVRLASYLQIHEYCDDAKKYYGLKYMDGDLDGDGIPSWDEVKGRNIVIKYKNCSSNLFVITKMGMKDTDMDGIDDNDEIFGKNGFVTDPTNPDTDGDSILDGADKYPTYSCESTDSKLMPVEWAEYWSRGAKDLYEKLLIADADPDGDGFTNKEEKRIDLNPTVADKETIIIFPKNPRLRNISGERYEGYFNVLINTNIMSYLQTSIDLWDSEIMSSLHIKYLDSEPLRSKVFKGKNLYSMNLLDRKKDSLFAHVQPMAVHKFKFVFSKDGPFSDINVNISCKIPFLYENEKNYKEICSKNISFKTCYSKFFKPEEPKIPKLLYPKPDQYFIEDKSVPCKWERDMESFWRGHPEICYMPCYDVFPDNKCSSFKYHFSFNEIVGSMVCYAWDLATIKLDKYEFTTWAYGSCLSYFNNITVISDYIPVFRTRRLTLDSTFVFKPDTLRNIRLQAKYGKKRFKKNDEEIKIHEKN
ncbi:hypothetical protein J6X96_02240 [bacterium]|nr:hypothetical protein [bacterium]